MHKSGIGVTKVGLRLPGTIVQCAPQNKFVQEPWYVVEWVDGNVSEERHRDLQPILPPNNPTIILLLD